MEGDSVVVNQVDDDLIIDLPPGFRFHPTDEEIITHYLTEKVMNSSFTARAIGEVDLNKCEPWDLPKKAKMGEKEWYFFCQRDRKYPTGMRTNRATESGYWKATGKDKEIYKGIKGCLVGMKKTLVFYKGRAPKGEKSNWVTHEYRLEGNSSHYNFPKGGAKDEWVVCRVFHKNSTGMKRSPIVISRMESSCFGDDLLDCPNSLPHLMDPPAGSSGYTADIGEDEFKGTASTTSDGNYLSYFSTISMMMNDDQVQPHHELQKQVQDHKNFTKAAAATPKKVPTRPNSIFYPPDDDQTQLIAGASCFRQLQAPPINYSHQPAAGNNDQAILRALAAKKNHIGSSSSSSTLILSELDQRQHCCCCCCKVEQLSSSNPQSSMVMTSLSHSQDTTTEISSSSVVNISKQHNMDPISNNCRSSCHDHLHHEDPNWPVAPISDHHVEYSTLWN